MDDVLAIEVEYLSTDSGMVFTARLSSGYVRIYQRPEEIDRKSDYLGSATWHLDRLQIDGGENPFSGVLLRRLHGLLFRAGYALERQLEEQCAKAYLASLRTTRGFVIHTEQHDRALPEDRLLALRRSFGHVTTADRILHAVDEGPAHVLPFLPSWARGVLEADGGPPVTDASLVEAIHQLEGEGRLRLVGMAAKHLDDDGAEWEYIAARWESRGARPVSPSESPTDPPSAFAAVSPPHGVEAGAVVECMEKDCACHEMVIGAESAAQA